MEPLHYWRGDAHCVKVLDIWTSFSVTSSAGVWVPVTSSQQSEVTHSNRIFKREGRIARDMSFILWATLNGCDVGSKSNSGRNE